MKLNSATKKLEEGIEETLTYMSFPIQHWRKIRTNNTIERLNREIKRRTRSIGTFPDGEKCIDACLRPVTTRCWYQLGKQMLYEHESSK